MGGKALPEIPVSLPGPVQGDVPKGYAPKEHAPKEHVLPGYILSGDLSLPGSADCLPYICFRRGEGMRA